MDASFRKLMAAGIVTLGLTAGGAQAGFINGSVGVSDAGITLSNLPNTMVSQLTSLTLGGVIPITACTVDLVPACSGVAIAPATTMTIPVGPVPPIDSMSVTFVTGGFTWNFSIITSLTRTAPTNDTDLVGDSIALIGIGTVTGAGFDPTLARIVFSASGSCNAASPGSTTCADGTATNQWQATLTARGINTTVPEPGILALLGVALAGLGLSRRKMG